MIYIKNNTFSTYANDVRDLVNAFYPGAGTSEIGLDAGIPSLGEPDLLLDMDSFADEIVRDENRFEEKTNLKNVLYRCLSEMSGRKLPWGTLTGIRPVRIIEMLKAKGLTPSEIDFVLRKRFLISDVKAELMKDIYERENSVLSAIDYKNGQSIYIGIPFCPTRCLYCSFTSNPISEWKERADEYLDCLHKEMKALVEGRIGGGIRKSSGAFHQAAGEGAKEGSIFRRENVQTIYIGGGTPTALSDVQLDKLLCSVEECFGDIRNFAEFTVEAGRPDSITREKLEVLKAHGVSRISINPQTFNQKTLDLIGRKHSAEQVIEAYALARSLGFDNINMDLIMGLPGEGLDEVAYTLDRIMELKPDNLTVHTLAVKRASRLSTEGKAWGGVERKGSSASQSEADEIAKMTEMGAECAAKLGMNPYYIYRQKNMAGNQENVGYAVPGKECMYNILMMEEKHSVYGLGAGSSTKTVQNGSVKRSDNFKNISDYMIYMQEKIC